MPGEPGGDAWWQRLTAGQHAHAGQRAGLLGEQGLPQRRTGLHHGDPVPSQQPGQQRGITDLVARGEDDGAAVGERGEQLQRGDVERDGGDREQGLAGTGRDPAAQRVQQVGEVRVGHLHPFGPARRAGREDHVRGVRACRWGGGGDRSVLGHHEPVDHARQRGVHAGNQHQAGRGVLDDHPEPLGRVLGVERDVGGAGLHDREQRDHQVDRPRQGDPDHGTAPDAARGQHAGQPVGTGDELGPGHRVRPAHDRGGVRVCQRPCVDQVDDGVRCDIVPGVVPPPDQLAFGVGQHLQVPHRHRRRRDHRTQHPREPGRNGFDEPGGETTAAVVEAEGQPLAGQHDQAQRVVVGVAAGHAGDHDAVRGTGGCRVHRVVLEHHDRVEEPVHPAGALDLGEPDVLVR